MKVKISELDKRIEIGTIDYVKDDEGFKTERFIPMTKPWAKVKNMSGTEVFKTGQEYNKVNARFLIRYRKDIELTSEMKIRFDSKLYNIVYVNNYNYSNEFIELIAEVID